MNLKHLKKKKIAILGLGREGKSLLNFFIDRGVKDLTLCDQNEAALAALKNNHLVKFVKFQSGQDYLKDLGRFDLIFKSPGISSNLPEIRRALKKGVQLSSATNLFFDLCPAKIIGVTGTKGKGTTATILYGILKAAGRPAHLLGNIGQSALDYLAKIKKSDAVIMELSSFQLQYLRKSPALAVVLAISQDHLDHHRSLREYRLAKSNIARFQKKKDLAILAADNVVANSFARLTLARKFYFGRPAGIKNGAILKNGQAIFKIGGKEEILFGKDDLQIPGEHNFENATAAALAARLLGIPQLTIIKFIKKFKGNEHRLEFLGKYQGVKVYNDSAATNPIAVQAAVSAFAEPKIIILGGRDKGFSYRDLAWEISQSNMRAVILFGENKTKLLEEFKAVNQDFTRKKIHICVDLETAVSVALKLARAGDVILFSPASASFDMFTDYNERGRLFKKLIGQYARRP